MIERLVSWRDYDTFDNLMEMRDGPFGEFGTMSYFERGGRNWVRMKHVLTDSFVDIELRPSGYMGEILEVD